MRWQVAVRYIVFVVAVTLVTTLAGSPLSVTSAQSSQPDFGDGHDGDTVISGNVDLNQIRAAASGTAGSTTLTISGETGGGFQNEEQVVLIHQTRGSNAGTWELRHVLSAGGGQLTLSEPLEHTYVTDGGASRAQVIRVPQYHNVTVQIGGSISPAPWDGNTGGIVAFLADSTTTISGTINASTRGYRGASSRGVQGEGTGGPGTGSTAPNGNGGGGGGRDGTWATGGGGGGHRDRGGNGGRSGNGVPGIGGLSAGTDDLSTMVFGGGGGSGGDNPNYQTIGGAGGGIVVIISANLTVSGGTIAITGGGGTNSPDNGGSGAGAGGSLFVRGQNVDIGITRTDLAGGIGGQGKDGVPGGSGSLGRIHIEYCNTFSGSTFPPAHVQQLVCVPPNEPPVAVAGTSLDANNQLELDGSLSSDPNGDSLTFSWQISGEASPRLGEIVSIADLSPGNYSVVLSVFDGLETSIDTMLLGVPATNRQPVIAADRGVVTVDEGGPADNAGTVSDLDGDPVTLSASVGVVTGNGDGTWSWTYATSDGATQSQLVTITAGDGRGGISRAMFYLLVSNVAPTADFTNTSGPVNEGEGATLAFSNQSDPSADDTAAGFLYSYDCNSDGTFELSNAPLASFECVYPDNGVFTARGRIADKDGGVTEYLLQVGVDNLPSSVEAGPDTSVTRGVPFELRATFTDPGVYDTHTAIIRWGDGTEQAGSVDQGADTVIGSHTYTVPGIYTVTVCVTDNDGATTCDSLKLEVRPGPPPHRGRR